MWFQKLYRDHAGKASPRAGASTALVALALAAVACAPAYVTDSTAPVNLYVAAITGDTGAGTVMDSDVRNGVGGTFVCPDYATVEVAVRNKNPGAPAPNVSSAVIVDAYEVRYYRMDGRGVEGLDVPYRITGNLTVAVDVEHSGTTAIPIEIVRRQAKIEPPLNAIYQTALLSVMAEVTLYGETIAGQRVSDSGRIQIDFADYGDSETSCPTGTGGEGGGE